jgi:hypothetical protein
VQKTEKQIGNSYKSLAQKDLKGKERKKDIIRSLGCVGLELSFL